MKNVLKYSLSFFLFISSCFCFAQQDKIDSLLHLLKNANPDTNKINQLNSLGKELVNYNLDSSILLTKQALKLSENQNWKKGTATSLGNLGNYNYLKADYASALEYYLKSLQIDEELKNKNGIATRLGNIGIIYVEKGDYSKSLDYFLQALKMDEEAGDKKGAARHLSNIGSVYRNQGDFIKSLDYLFKSLKISEEQGNKNGISS